MAVVSWWCYDVVGFVCVGGVSGDGSGFVVVL